VTKAKSWVYYLDAPLPRFVEGRVVFPGDAAHAVTPDIGQGACLAIEDAVVLADALAGADIDEALAGYDVIRRRGAGRRRREARFGLSSLVTSDRDRPALRSVIAGR
jgi:2-polyprenyl-6-methoxyphenol hydroxylase-like FAD-dependent oxidoreductase